MQAQRYRHRITFQEPLITIDSGTGAEEVSWVNAVLPDGTELVDVPAEVLTGAGREFNASGAIQGEVAARIACHWFPGLDQAWRILWLAETFNIGAFDSDRSDRREYRIRCTGRVNEG